MRRSRCFFSNSLRTFSPLRFSLIPNIPLFSWLLLTLECLIVAQQFRACDTRAQQLPLFSNGLANFRLCRRRHSIVVDLSPTLFFLYFRAYMLALPALPPAGLFTPSFRPRHIRDRETLAKPYRTRPRAFTCAPPFAPQPNLTHTRSSVTAICNLKKPEKLRCHAKVFFAGRHLEILLPQPIYVFRSTLRSIWSQNIHNWPWGFVKKWINRTKQLWDRNSRKSAS